MLLRELTTTPAPAIPAAMAKSLIEGMGGTDYSASILTALNYVAEFNHCTAFEFHSDGPPAVIGVSSCYSVSKVVRSTNAYLHRFHHYEPMRPVMQQRRDGVFLRYHICTDLENAEFRRTCYEAVAIVDRVSIAASTRSGSWFVVNLFRDAAQGPLPEQQLDAVTKYASFVAMAGRRDALLRARPLSDSPSALREHLQDAAPELSKREGQVCSLILAGSPQEEIARQLGIRLSSVVTFRKRAYQKLNVHSSQQLRDAFMPLPAWAISTES